MLKRVCIKSRDGNRPSSHDRTKPAKPRCGSQSGLLGNLIFTEPEFGNILPGVFTPVLAKHSKSFSLIDCISVGVDPMQWNFEPMRKWKRGRGVNSRMSQPKW